MKRKNFHFYLTKYDNFEPLSIEEINQILRASDEIIGLGGRTMIAKILKGSRDKKLLELKNINEDMHQSCHEKGSAAYGSWADYLCICCIQHNTRKIRNQCHCHHEKDEC